MRKTVLPALALAFTGSALATDIGAPTTNAVPGPNADRGVPTLASVDRDGDGSVSRQEAARNKVLVKEWETLDQNRDGKLDKGEFARLETESMRGTEEDGPRQAPGQPMTPVKPGQ